MIRLLHTFSAFESYRGRFSGLPSWARLIITILAIPGIILLGLSFLAVLVSILALLVLTVPAYRVLSWLTGGRENRAAATPMEQVSIVNEYVESDDVPAPRRHIDVKIVE